MRLSSLSFPLVTRELDRVLTARLLSKVDCSLERELTDEVPSRRRYLARIFSQVHRDAIHVHFLYPIVTSLPVTWPSANVGASAHSPLNTQRDLWALIGTPEF